MEQLAKEQFYEIIFVLFMVHRNEAFMDTVFKTMLLYDSCRLKGGTKDKEQISLEFKNLLT